MNSRTIYLLLALVFVISVAIAVNPSVGDLTRAVTALPAAVAVIAALFQLLRDQAAHDRAIAVQAAENSFQLLRDQAAQDREMAVQAAQNSFALGATSHMASVAFDKHVAFSEEYVSEVLSTLSTLFRAGPTGEVLPHSAKLYQIRQRWAIWITPAVEAELEKFEAALRTIGAEARFVEIDLANPARSETIREMYRLFAEVTGMAQWDEKPVTPDRAIVTVVQGLRRVLGIEELTQLRQTFISRSLRHTG